jgi:hypothetical protein
MYQKDISNLDNAAQSGQQDVFDASAIGALVNVGDIDSELADYIPHLLRALDKLGRTLFLLHWHSEEMQEKYGKTEARDMEEDIKNVFENLGDVVLDMKKSVPNSDDLFGAGIMGDGSQGN